MKLKLTNDQLKNVEWLQFHANKTNQMVAMAVDPTSEERTGVARFVNGAVIPAEAMPAEPGTRRDPFCEDILRRVEEANATRVEREAARAAKRKPPTDGVHIRGDLAEVWKGGVMLGTFPAEKLDTLPSLFAEKPKRGKKAATA